VGVRLVQCSQSVQSGGRLWVAAQSHCHLLHRATKLNATSGPVKTLVIDHVEQP
jgi:hypothetical protein